MSSKRNRASTSRSIPDLPSEEDEFESGSESEEEEVLAAEQVGDDGEESEEEGLDKILFQSAAAKDLFFSRKETVVVRAHRYSHPPTLDLMGMLPILARLFESIGAGKVLSLNLSNYECLTREFLSTVRVRYRNIYKSTMDVKFALGNEIHVMTIRELNQVLGGCDVTDYGLSADDQRTFWYAISGQIDFESGTALAKHIVNPVLRVAQKLISHVLYGRPESSKVRTCELACLYHMIHGGKINLGWEVANRLVELAKRPRTEIRMGGFVALLADHLGVDFDRYSFIDGEYIELGYFTNTKQYRYNKTDKVYSIFIAQTQRWERISGSPYLSPLEPENIMENWTRVHRDLGSSQAMEVDATVGASSSQPVPERRARRSRPQTQEESTGGLAELQRQVSQLGIAQAAMASTQDQMRSDLDGMGTQLAGMSVQNQNILGMMQQMYYHQFQHSYNPNFQWQPPPSSPPHDE